MYRLFTKFDMFHHTPNLTYNQGKGYSTFTGIVISVGFYIFFVALFVYEIIQVINRKHSSKDFFQSFDNGENNFLELSKIPLAFKVKLNLFHPNGTSAEYIGLKAFHYLNYEVNILDSQNEPVKNNITITRCNETLHGNYYEKEVKQDYLSYFKVNNETIDNYVCLKLDKDYKIYKGRKPGKGNEYPNGFETLLFKNKKLKPDVKFYITAEVLYYSDPYNIKASNPFFSKQPNSERILLSNRLLVNAYTYRDEVSVTYRITNYTTDNNLFIESLKTEKHFLIENYRRIRKTTDNPLPRRYIAIVININGTVDHIILKYWKITDLFAYLGGILKFISLPIKLGRLIYKKFLSDELLRYLNSLEGDKFNKLSDDEEKQNDYNTETRNSLNLIKSYHVNDSNKESRNSSIDGLLEPKESKNNKSDIKKSYANTLEDVLITTFKEEENENVFEKKSNQGEYILTWWENVYYSNLGKCCRNEKIEQNLEKRKSLRKRLNYLIDIKTVLRVMRYSGLISNEKDQICP